MLLFPTLSQARIPSTFFHWISIFTLPHTSSSCPVQSRLTASIRATYTAHRCTLIDHPHNCEETRKLRIPLRHYLRHTVATCLVVSIILQRSLFSNSLTKFALHFVWHNKFNIHSYRENQNSVTGRSKNSRWRIALAATAEAIKIFSGQQDVCLSAQGDYFQQLLFLCLQQYSNGFHLNNGYTVHSEQVFKYEKGREEIPSRIVRIRIFPHFGTIN